MQQSAPAIKKNDNVVVTAGRDKGQARARPARGAVDTGRVVVEGVNFIKRHTRPNPQKNMQGRHRGARSARCTRRTCSSSVRSAARPPASAAGGSTTVASVRVLRQVQGSGGQMNRLRERYLDGRDAGASQGVRVHERHGRAQDHEGGRQHGPGRGNAEREDRRHGRRRAAQDHGAEGGGDAREEVDRAVQGAQGHAHRRDGHAARRADVRVPRPPDRDRPAARARLPRRVGRGLRRPRQLHARAARPVDVPGDRLPEGRQVARHEHLGHHDGQDRRRSPAAAAARSGCRSGRTSEKDRRTRPWRRLQRPSRT